MKRRTFIKSAAAVAVTASTPAFAGDGMAHPFTAPLSQSEATETLYLSNGDFYIFGERGIEVWTAPRLTEHYLASIL